MSKTNHTNSKDSKKSVEQKEKQAIIGGVGNTPSNELSVAVDNLKRSTTLKRLIIIAIILVLGVVSVLWLAKTYRLSPSMVIERNCVEDSEVIDFYNQAIKQTAPADQYDELVKKISNKLNFDEDITCQYIAFQSYTMTGNITEAGEAYMKLKRLFEAGEVIPDGLFTDTVDIKVLLQDYNYYDTDNTQNDVEVLG